MGGSSTSHSAVLRREHGGRETHDLRSWQGLTDVLRMAKESLPPSEHDSFRDLVLQYAQRGGDAELKAEIDAVIARLEASKETPAPEPEAAHEVLPEASPETSPRSYRPGMNSMRRPLPRFLPKSLAYEEAAPTKEIPMEVVEDVAPLSESLSVLEPEPLPHTPLETPVVPPQPEAEEAPVVSRTLEEHKTRIMEIKRLVNEQIGNPVALVGTHKEVGKAYMQALLTALKATGGGGTGVEAAMRRLEDAYSALLTDKPHTTDTPESVPTPAPVVTPEKEDEPREALTPIVEEAREVTPEVPVGISPEPIEEPEIEPVAQSRFIKVTEAPAREVPVSVSIPSRDSHPIDELKHTPPPPKEDPPPKPLPKIPPAFNAFRTHRAVTQQKEAERVTETPSRVVPPPKDPPIEEGLTGTKYTNKKIGAASTESLAASGIDADQTAVRQSELVSPEITKALHALLHEWNIFASSGLFGTGPSGPEHPLYLKLAPLSMGEIITGRYEGADRQVNNVIHDYVNAWRHEQGIAYTPSETFEHYLRRVVQRIQKRQARS